MIAILTRENLIFKIEKNGNKANNSQLGSNWNIKFVINVMIFKAKGLAFVLEEQKGRIIGIERKNKTGFQNGHCVNRNHWKNKKKNIVL